MGNKSRQDGDQKTSNDLVETSASDIPVSEFKSMKISNSGDDLQNDSKSHSSTAVPSSAHEPSSTQKYVPPHLRNKSSSAPFVKSELVGKFIALPEKEISTKDFEWRHLYESNVCDNVLFDLNEGFDSSIDYGAFWEDSISQIAKFIMKTTTESTTLKEAVHGCEFVASRSTLAHIASYGTLKRNQMSNKVQSSLHRQFIFTKFKDVIFVDGLSVSTNQNEKEMNRKYYWSFKLDHTLISERLEVLNSPDLEEFTLPCPLQFGLFKAEITDSNERKLSCFISARVKGLDKDNKFVEIKDQSFGLTLKQPWYKPEPNWLGGYKTKWWLQASLANVERIIVGIHDSDGIVKKVKELRMTDVENPGKNWEPKDSVEFLLDIFNEAQELLGSKPERSLLKLETFSNRKETSMTWIKDDDREQYEFLPPAFVEHFSSKQ